MASRQPLSLGTWSAIIVSLLFWNLDAAHAQSPAAATQRAWSLPSDDAIRRLLAERTQSEEVAVVVGVIGPDGRRVVTYGKSGASDGRALDGDTVFQIGSVTKVLTNLLFADMIERGEVQLNDPASKYLPPGVTMPERVRPITLLDLATHRSGLPSMPTNFVMQAEPNPYAAYSVEELHQFLSTHKLDREPGARSEYSNLGVALLGRLLARRAGKDYEALMRERVLEPLGMHSTSVTLTSDQTKRLAPGHDRYLDPVETWELTTLPASGSLRSTANDMLRFLAANLGYTETRLATALMYQRFARQPPNGSAALGWGVSKTASGEVFGHEGGKEGYRSAILLDPNARSGIVVLMNARTGDRPMTLARHLLHGRPLPPVSQIARAPATVAVEPRLLEMYAGAYELAPLRYLEVQRKDDHLLVYFPGGGITKFFAQGPRDFFARTEDVQLTFQVGADGAVTGLISHEDGRDRKAPRVAQALSPNPL